MGVLEGFVYKFKNEIKGVKTMEKKVIELYIKNKVVMFINKRILEVELKEKAKKGVEKFNKVFNSFLNDFERWIIEEKEKDRKWLPNFIEDFTENLIHDAIKSLRETYDIKKLIQEIFDEERKNKIL